MDLSSLFTAIAPLDLRSCLITQQGQLTFKHYRDLQTETAIARINSCTKSVLASLICIAIDKGLLPPLMTSISVFFPQLAQHRDSRKKEITLLHLLTMSAGFNWTEFGGQNSFPRMARSPNWVNFVLEQPLSDSPGVRMEYNSGVSQLLSAILVQATGMTTARFAELYLFELLEIESYKWEMDPQGIHTGGFGLWLSPSDMLKFGQLYLQQGKWDNKQLISQELVARSVRSAFLVEAPRQGYYGWHWWTDSYPVASNNSSTHSVEYFYARGYGGQYIYIVPSLKTVVVLTNDKRKKEQYPVDVFRQIIAPLLLQQL
ncbi:serine hydrolase domain-containing protein [Paenibacillus aestuarii]|uniref:Serine hydrolase domain-containing protein n=1 Tax=Paenibacillus aestuarii TaxID=516965 RepID=A0ABW0KDT8_9BACL|nr:serine hydrolase [Paenibacillus aestuarii]